MTTRSPRRRARGITAVTAAVVVLVVAAITVGVVLTRGSNPHQQASEATEAACPSNEEFAAIEAAHNPNLTNVRASDIECVGVFARGTISFALPSGFSGVDREILLHTGGRWTVLFEAVGDAMVTVEECEERGLPADLARRWCI